MIRYPQYLKSGAIAFAASIACFVFLIAPLFVDRPVWFYLVALVCLSPTVSFWRSEARAQERRKKIGKVMQTQRLAFEHEVEANCIRLKWEHAGRWRMRCCGFKCMQVPRNFDDIEHVCRPIVDTDDDEGEYRDFEIKAGNNLYAFYLAGEMEYWGGWAFHRKVRETVRSKIFTYTVSVEQAAAAITDDVDRDLQ
jgi:hypothetical protein